MGRKIELAKQREGEREVEISYGRKMIGNFALSADTLSPCVIRRDWRGRDLR